MIIIRNTSPESLRAVFKSGCPMLLIVALVTLAWTPAAVVAQDPPEAPAKLPEAKVVLGAALEKMGGEKAFDAIKTMKQMGEFSMAAMGMNGDMTVYYHADGRYDVSVDMGEVGTQRNGYDGKVMWEVNPMQGPRIIKGDEKAINLRMNRINPFKDVDKFYKKSENKGVEKVGQYECYKIKMTPKVGEHEYHFIDTKTYLVRRSKVTMPSAMGEMEAIIDIKSYKKVGDVSLPSAQSMEIGGMMTMTMKFASITVNEELPKDVFALPEGIKKLVEKAASESRPAKKGKSG